MSMSQYVEFDFDEFCFKVRDPPKSEQRDQGNLEDRLNKFIQFSHCRHLGAGWSGTAGCLGLSETWAQTVLHSFAVHCTYDPYKSD